MKPSLTRLQWIAVIGLAAIGLLGGGGLFYLSQQLDDAQAAVQTQDAALHKLTGARYLPSDENIETLKKNDDLLKAGIDALQQRLRTPGNKLGEVREKNPVVFKQELAETLRGLSDLAAKNNVKIDPSAASFGFSSYQNNNPTQAATRILGKQQIGIQEVGAALFNAKITMLNAVRRTFDENGNGAAAAANAAAAAGVPSGGESLRAMILSPGQGLYTVYPLEFEFTGPEASVRAALANIAASPYVLVPRFLVVTSTRATPPHIGDAAPGADSSSKKPTFIVMMGDDDVRVRLRVDLIDWTGKVAPPAAAKAGPRPKNNPKQ